MRYRQFGNWGISVSALSLRLTGTRCPDSAEAWTNLIRGAFECGVNAFEVHAPTAALLAGLGEAVKLVERRLLFIAMACAPGSHAEDIFQQVDEAIEAAGLRYFDLVTVDGESHPSTDAVWMLEELRATPKVRLMGVSGLSEAIDQYIQGGAFDVLVHPFNVTSGWRDRLRVRRAVEQAMCVIGVDHFPDEVLPHAQTPTKKAGWFIKAKPAPLSDIGGYGFLRNTQGWTAESLCFGFALTEPSLASVMVEPEGIEHVTLLAAVTERDLPAATGAQIEMARFSAERQSGAERRSA